jgi:ketosteroid isomerase-like protein
MVAGCSSHPDYKIAEEYIIQSEKEWAESMANGDTSVIQRILADDFIGVSPDGKQYRKQQMIEDTKHSPEYFISNYLNNVKVRFYGDMAIAQGDETWITRSEIPDTGRLVWTDTWLFRNNIWQIVAAEDLIVKRTKTQGE